MGILRWKKLSEKRNTHTNTHPKPPHMGIVRDFFTGRGHFFERRTASLVFCSAPCRRSVPAKIRHTHTPTREREKGVAVEGESRGSLRTPRFREFARVPLRVGNFSEG